VPDSLGQGLAFPDIVVLVAFVDCFPNVEAVEADEETEECEEIVEMHGCTWGSHAVEIAVLEKEATSGLVAHIHKILPDQDCQRRVANQQDRSFDLISWNLAERLSWEFVL
jgi:hypothetical protein